MTEAFPDRQTPYQRHLWGFRILAVITIGWGLYYFFWRYTSSLNMDTLWLALILVFVQSYPFADTFFFVLMMWKPARREGSPPPPAASVDILIATYNEPVNWCGSQPTPPHELTWPIDMSTFWTMARVQICNRWLLNSVAATSPAAKSGAANLIMPRPEISTMPCFKLRASSS